jgi:hypothetical protein
MGLPELRFPLGHIYVQLVLELKNERQELVADPLYGRPAQEEGQVDDKPAAELPYVLVEVVVE